MGKLTIQFDSLWDARQFFEFCERNDGRASLRGDGLVIVDVPDDVAARYFEKAARARGGSVSE